MIINSISELSDFSKIKHLYSRAGFGFSPTNVLELRNRSLTDCVDNIFEQTQNKGYLKQIDLSYFTTSAARMNENRNDFLRNSALNIRETNLNWINQMAADSSSQLVEKMTLFWHGHFATFLRFSHTAINQNNMLRQHCLGNFRDLLIGISQDPGMLVFLNNNANRKDSINENYGRELLELFTMGVGNYTQNDVVEASRAFTGWSHSDHHKFKLIHKNHDEGVKTFLGKTGNFNGEDIIDIILEKKATAKFIVEKIYKYFVNESVDQSMVSSLTEEFYNSDYDVGKLMNTIFRSDWFYNEKNRGSKVKSPTDLIVGILKTFSARLNNSRSLYLTQMALGQALFEPPSVAGWPSGKLWINNSNILIRVNLAKYIAQNFSISPSLKSYYAVTNKAFGYFPVEATASTAKLTDIFECCKDVELLQGLSQVLLHKYTNTPFSSKSFSSGKDNVIHTALQIMSRPEYQLC